MSDNSNADEAHENAAKRRLLRHSLATVAYRASKAVVGAPEEYPTFRISEGARTPTEVVAHVADLFAWAVALAHGQESLKSGETAGWEAELVRLETALHEFDRYLASGKPLFIGAEQLLQGPIADALSHVGQLTMLRRAVGSPVRRENYARAPITIGNLAIAPASEGSGG